MSRRPQIRPYVYSVGYAALVFIPLHQPGLLVASILQLTICGCFLALLLLFLANREEIREFVEAVFCACASLLLCLLPAAEGARRQSADPAVPAEPCHTALLQRPPPRFA